MASKQKNANYNNKQKQPSSPMGSGSFCNLPTSPIVRPFSKGASYRDGIMNNPSYGIDEDSGVDENGCR